MITTKGRVKMLISILRRSFVVGASILVASCTTTSSDEQEYPCVNHVEASYQFVTPICQRYSSPEHSAIWITRMICYDEWTYASDSLTCFTSVHPDGLFYLTGTIRKIEVLHESMSFDFSALIRSELEALCDDLALTYMKFHRCFYYPDAE